MFVLDQIVAVSPRLSAIESNQEIAVEYCVPHSKFSNISRKARHILVRASTPREGAITSCCDSQPASPVPEHIKYQPHTLPL